MPALNPGTTPYKLCDLEQLTASLLYLVFLISGGYNDRACQDYRSMKHLRQRLAHGK